MSENGEYGGSRGRGTLATGSSWGRLADKRMKSWKGELMTWESVVWSIAAFAFIAFVAWTNRPHRSIER